MFQTFSATTSPDTGSARAAWLRAEMVRQGIDGFLVPRADAHQGENVAPHDERLAWLTGFTGSAGLCVVLADRAAIFVDGRYRLQVRAQTDGAVFTPMAVPRDKPEDWVAANLSKGCVLGFDPWLHGRKEIETYRKVLAEAGIAVRPVAANPIDAVWPDQPPPPKGRAEPYLVTLAGRDHVQKLTEIAAAVTGAGCRAVVITLPDSIAWLFNIRGSDIARTPVVHGFAIVHEDGRAEFFVDPDKVGDALRAHLGAAVRLRAPDAFGPALETLTGPVALDERTAPLWVLHRLEAGGAEVRWLRDPCTLPKACKTDAELEGSRAAHRRDGAAMAEFLCWLDTAAPAGGLTEIDVVKKLETARRAGNLLRDISFETICGAGPDGAIVHYRVTEGTDRRIAPGEVLLIDSGGQYLDGTTDITRTVATGPVDPEARRAFTLVLKGMIAISRARWPEGLAGRDLDALARSALWHAGFDYDHGTGHGVGVYLGVHEGPQSLSRRSDEPLLPGMILSNEPGYYREGAFGIRIENLLVVTPATVPDGGERAMLAFETLTLAPIDRRLIDTRLLTGDERGWIDGYHARVLAEIGPHVTAATKSWLEVACKAM